MSRNFGEIYRNSQSSFPHGIIYSRASFPLNLAKKQKTPFLHSRARLKTSVQKHHVSAA